MNILSENVERYKMVFRLFSFSPFFPTMYIYLFPFGFQYTFITLPQLGHFSDTIIQPEPVSPMSQARFLHRLSGHFIFRIILPPLPQNTSIAISPHWYWTREPACPCLVGLLLMGDMSFISRYAFASKLFCGFSTLTASSPASGMPLFAFPHASL